MVSRGMQAVEDLICLYVCSLEELQGVSVSYLA